VRGWVCLAALVALSGCSRPASAGHETVYVRMPDLTGMSMPESRRALERAGLQAEPGERLDARGDGVKLEFAARPDATVTGQSTAPGQRIGKGEVVGVATTGSGVMPTQWRGDIAFEHGRVVLSGLDRWDPCYEYDHAQLEPARHGARVIRLWLRGDEPGRACDPMPRAVTLRPSASWTARTVGVPQPLDLPDAKFKYIQGIAGFDAVLQPDRRSIYLGFSHGGCDGVASVDATLDGKVATVRLVIGYDQVGGNCSAVGVNGGVLVRLPAEAPPGTEILRAECGGASRMRCYD
jgi:PASTA domain